MSARATLLVRRGRKGGPEDWARYEVVFEPGQSVLDGLRRIRAEQDPSLAFRYSCINANACKECMMQLDWLDLRNMLLVAQTVVLAALERKESRGAHQREDFPGLLPEWETNQVLSWHEGKLGLKRLQTNPAAPEAR